VGVLRTVVAVPPGSVVVVVVGSSALAAVVGSVLVKELPAWRAEGAPVVTAQTAPLPPTSTTPRSARVIRFLKSLPRRLMEGILSLLVDV
jgi:hypothetical protein